MSALQHAASPDGGATDRVDEVAATRQPRAIATPTAPTVPVDSKEVPGLGRSIAIACSVTVSVTFAAITLSLVATGTSLGSAIGIGLFAGVWGGGGFGAMIGGVVHAHRPAGPAVI